MSLVSESVRIGILGDFNPEFAPITRPTISLPARRAKAPAPKVDIGMDSNGVAPRSGRPRHPRFLRCLWASPGSPYKSFEGMLKASSSPASTTAVPRYLRRLPVHAHRVANGSRPGRHAEEDPNAKNIVMLSVACAVAEPRSRRRPSFGKVSEIRSVRLLSRGVLWKELIEEEFFCNYELNPEFEWMAMDSGLSGLAAAPRKNAGPRIPRICFRRNLVPTGNCRHVKTTRIR